MPKNNFFKVSHKSAGEDRFVLQSKSAQLFFFHMCRLRNRPRNGAKQKDGWLRFSDKELGILMAMHPNTILSARHELEMNGYLQFKTTKNRKACRYLIIDEPYRDDRTTNNVVPEGP